MVVVMGIHQYDSWMNKVCVMVWCVTVENGGVVVVVGYILVYIVGGIPFFVYIYISL